MIVAKDFSRNGRGQGENSEFVDSEVILPWKFLSVIIEMNDKQKKIFYDEEGRNRWLTRGLQSVFSLLFYVRELSVLGPRSNVVSEVGTEIPSQVFHNV